MSEPAGTKIHGICHDTGSAHWLVYSFLLINVTGVTIGQYCATSTKYAVFLIAVVVVRYFSRYAKSTGTAISFVSAGGYLKFAGRGENDSKPKTT